MTIHVQTWPHPGGLPFALTEEVLTTDQTGKPNDSEQDAATDAAQNVVDDVTSYEYSGDKDRIEHKLDEGLDQAGVELDSAEKKRVAQDIDALKDDEGAGTPDVERARPKE